ncbi:MAG: hypothetical protein NXH90_13390 [Flavobacteriaceae bacterium]|nr:hypothetical protein [Flavobacteriaceae bacterium]
MKGTIGSIQGVPDAWSAMDKALDDRRNKETWVLGMALVYGISRQPLGRLAI